MTMIDCLYQFNVKNLTTWYDETVMVIYEIDMTPYQVGKVCCI